MRKFFTVALLVVAFLTVSAVYIKDKREQPVNLDIRQPIVSVEPSDRRQEFVDLAPLIETYKDLRWPLAEIAMWFFFTPKEKKEIYRLAWIESRMKWDAESHVEACGPFQIMPKWHGGTCERYKLDPFYSVYKVAKIYRKFKKRCGALWEKCYRYGPSKVLTKIKEDKIR